MSDSEADDVFALPARAEDVLPLVGTSPTSTRLSQSQQTALYAFLEALSSGRIQTRPVEMDGPLEIATCDRFGLPFRTLLCRRTGLLYTSPQIYAADIPTYYREFYHPLHFPARPVAAVDALYSDGWTQGEKIWQRLSSCLAGDAHELSVIEIGAGVGNVLAQLKLAAV
jgi:hypothetical protein